MKCLQLSVLIAVTAILLPLDSVARGGSAGVGGTQLMFGVIAILGVGWLISKVKEDTWKVLGGLLLLVGGIVWLVQVASAFLS